jgi:hypothetical protein
MKMYSPHWDEKNSCCLLHGVPQLPCNACLAEKDKDIEFVLDEIDWLYIDAGDTTVAELLPQGFTVDGPNTIRY